MKPVTQIELIEFANLASSSGYNEQRKKRYRFLGRKILKELAGKLNLLPNQVEIRWNPGGIAISGDHILHTDRVYVALHDNCGFGSFYWRTCKGLTDYTGGPNQNVPWTKLTAHGIDYLVNILNPIVNPKESHVESE